MKKKNKPNKKEPNWERFKLLSINKAIQIAKQSIDSDGGPFGALIVKNGKIIAEGNNCVTCDNDPTAHAEIVAIRRAAHELQTFQLIDCELYSSSEPCPMCLSAIYWAGIKTVYYANDHEQASAVGFDDGFIYQELGLPHAQKKINIQQIDEAMVLQGGQEIFQKWLRKSDRIPY